MITIIYRSDATALLPYSASTEICLKSVVNNSRDKITGFLIDHQNVFLQVLEGDQKKVDALYAKIVADPRHHNVRILTHLHTEEKRSFGFWAMNFGPLNTEYFWKSVLEQPISAAEFHRRSYEPQFAFDVLSRSYQRAQHLASVDPSVRTFVDSTTLNHTPPDQPHKPLK